MKYTHTPFEIAEAWYSSDEIKRNLQDRISNRQMPLRIDSDAFAEWLTTQYRLAMAKGVQLGRDERR